MRLFWFLLGAVHKTTSAVGLWERELDNVVFSNESEPCHLCLNQDDVLSFPNKDITSLLPPPPPDVPFLIAPNTTITCGVFASLALPTFAMESEECETAQRFLSGLCGCPPLPNHCEFCDPDTLPYPDRVVQASQTIMGLPEALSCGDLSLLMTQVPGDSDECRKVSYPLSRWCDCEATGETAHTAFAGATTETKRKAMVWVARVFAFISFCCSSYILWDIQRKRRKRGKSFWQTPVKLVILSAISVCDIFIAVAFLVGPAAMPEEVDGDSNVFWGAYGTEGTCKAQGFFIAFGVTGVYYYMGLTLYYLLTIRYGWSETRAHNIRWCFHFPLVMGLGLASAGLPFYESVFFGCYVPGPPQTTLWKYLLLFNFIPLWITMTVSVTNLGLVYASVRHRDRNADRWRLTGGPSRNMAASGSSHKTARKSVFKGGSRLERAVFWQCVAYFLAGLVPAAIMTFALSTGEAFSDVENIYWWNLFVVSMAPSQGIWNYFVYKRPLARRRNQRGIRSSKSSDLPSSVVNNTELSTAAAKNGNDEEKPLDSADAVTWNDDFVDEENLQVQEESDLDYAYDNERAAKERAADRRAASDSRLLKLSQVQQDREDENPRRGHTSLKSVVNSFGGAQGSSVGQVLEQELGDFAEI